MRTHGEVLRLEDRSRSQLWRKTAEIIEHYIRDLNPSRVTPELDPGRIRALLSDVDFSRPMDPFQAIHFVVQALWQYQVHTAHPRYFGLFNPAPATMGIVADALVAAFNPQLASWSHSPFAVEVEQHLVRSFGRLFGYDFELTRGTFASGGSEANHTALLSALVHRFPEFARQGLRGLDRQPTLYVSTESHYSFLKAARLSGLGTDAVREVPVDDSLRMHMGALSEQIARDRDAGFAPFMIAATAGTTNAGVVDALAEIADVGAHEKVWFHVDAAWGGAAALVPELRHVLEGIERSDSITFDAHKWLSVPMGAGLYLTRHEDILARTFRITADYMPRDAMGLDVLEPYAQSIQCSRRFIGLKVLMPLLVAGWDGYATVIRHQAAMGDLLRSGLEASGWKVMNETPLPVVCFADGQSAAGRSFDAIQKIVQDVVSSGHAWISSTRLNKDIPVIRACITNHLTEPEDIHSLVVSLNSARERFYER